MKEFATSFWTNTVFFKMAILEFFFITVISGLTTFTAISDGVKRDDWDKMWWMQKVRFPALILTSMLVAGKAFTSDTIGKLKQQKKDETTIWQKGESI